MSLHEKQANLILLLENTKIKVADGLAALCEKYGKTDTEKDEIWKVVGALLDHAIEIGKTEHMLDISIKYGKRDEQKEK